MPLPVAPTNLGFSSNTIFSGLAGVGGGLVGSVPSFIDANAPAINTALLYQAPAQTNAALFASDAASAADRKLMADGAGPTSTANAAAGKSFEWRGTTWQTRPDSLIVTGANGYVLYHLTVYHGVPGQVLERALGIEGAFIALMRTEGVVNIKTKSDGIAVSRTSPSVGGTAGVCTGYTPGVRVQERHMSHREVHLDLEKALRAAGGSPYKEDLLALIEFIRYLHTYRGPAVSDFFRQSYINLQSSLSRLFERSCSAFQPTRVMPEELKLLGVPEDYIDVFRETGDWNR